MRQRWLQPPLSLEQPLLSRSTAIESARLVAEAWTLMRPRRCAIRMSRFSPLTFREWTSQIQIMNHFFAFFPGDGTVWGVR